MNTDQLYFFRHEMEKQASRRLGYALAAGLGTAAGISLAVGKKGRKRMGGETRDPRLYSNLRGMATLETRKERVAAHKRLSKGDGTILGAMSKGFRRKQ